MQVLAQTSGTFFYDVNQLDSRQSERVWQPKYVALEHPRPNLGSWKYALFTPFLACFFFCLSFA